MSTAILEGSSFSKGTGGGQEENGVTASLWTGKVILIDSDIDMKQICERSRSGDPMATLGHLTDDEILSIKVCTINFLVRKPIRILLSLKF